MTTRLVKIPICSICYEPVKLETTKTDEHGKAIHEECYVLKLKRFQASQPSRRPPAAQS